jgi:LPS-assembly protein
MIPAAHAATPTWECGPGPDGGWECLKDGKPVPPPAIPKPSPPAPEQVREEPQPVIDQTPEPAAETTAPAPEATPDTQPVVEQTSEPEPPAAETADTTEPAPETAPDTRPAQLQEEPQPVVEQTTRPESPAESADTAVTPSDTREQAQPAPSVADRQPAAAGTAKKSPYPLRIDRDLNWNQCLPLNDPTRRVAEGETSQEINISADAADIRRDEHTAVFSGNVEVTWGDRLLEAHEIRYNQSDETLDASGDIYYQQPGLLISGGSAHLEMANDRGRLEDTQYRLPARRARGAAALAELLDYTRSRYEDISYSTCAPDDNGWELRANELEIDQESGTGTAYGSVLRFEGVPFFYLPYVSFPIDDRRKSGFLVPSIGHSSETGMDLTVPYYFNISPSMDATFSPRYMSKRGWLLGGEFRYLTDWYSSRLRAEIMPDDSTRNNGEDSLRGAISYKGGSFPTTRWQFSTDINYVSDHDYQEDLSGSLASSSARHLERRGDLRYLGDDWEFLGRLQHFQTIDQTIATTDRPYARLPQLLLSMEKQTLGALVAHLDTEYVYFDLDDAVRGQRFDIQPGLSLQLRNSWGYLIPKISGRYTTYDLENQGAGNPATPDRSLYTASLDTGLILERDGNWFGNTVIQTLEPRLFYLYTPRETQDDLPVFDTSEFDLSFANLFRENRFNGADRAGDANHLTAALTTRTLDSATGVELLRASIGQIYYFEDREVQLPGVVEVDESSSAIVGEIAARLSNHWGTRATVQWDPHADSDHTRQAAVHLFFRGDEGGVFNLAHRYRASLLDQSDLSFRWPIMSRLNLVGRWNHSWREDRNLEGFGGFEYDSCCWIFRMVARHHVNDENHDGTTGFFAQLELKGLTSIGSSVDDFLEEGILGYQSDN